MSAIFFSGQSKLFRYSVILLFRHSVFCVLQRPGQSVRLHDVVATVPLITSFQPPLAPLCSFKCGMFCLCVHCISLPCIEDLPDLRKIYTACHCQKSTIGDLIKGLLKIFANCMQGYN